MSNLKSTQIDHPKGETDFSPLEKLSIETFRGKVNVFKA